MNPIHEVGLVFLLIQLIIWSAGTFKFLPYFLGLVPLAFVLNYWRRNPETFKLLFRPAGDTHQYIWLGISFAIFWRVILFIGEIWNPYFFTIPGLPQKMFTLVLLYLPWAFFQQLMFNGYFLMRLQGRTQSETLQKKSVLISSILFSLIHLPNPVLVIVTFLGGLLSAHFFKQTRNLYALALAHAILAVSTLYFLPDSWHHHLRIGPGYFYY